MTHSTKWLVIILVISVLAVGTVLATLPNRRALLSATVELTEEVYDVPNVLNDYLLTLSDEELVGQLLVIGIDGKSLTERTVERLTELHPAGVILFGRNVSTAAQLRELTTALQESATELELPGLLLAIDQEGGRVARLKRGFTTIPPMGELPGKTDPAGARSVGEVIGRELAAVGCNWNLAPVVDVLTNPANPGIGDRSLSGDPTVVAEYATAIADGMNAAGIAVCAKHFPGKGEAALDAHYDLPTISVDRERLEKYEWPPFRALLGENQPRRTAMVSHVVIPELDDELPATLSPAAYTVLRSEIGFDGVAVTDDLEMGAIVKNYGLGEAGRMAISAGADTLLICHQLDRMLAARDALLSALAEETLTREELARHGVRVLLLKLSLGLPIPGLANYDHAFEQFCEYHGLNPAEQRSLLTEPPPLSVCGSAEHAATLREAGVIR